MANAKYVIGERYQVRDDGVSGVHEEGELRSSDCNAIEPSASIPCTDAPFASVEQGFCF